MNLPTGTVTFLFTDIEGSTKLWDQHPKAMSIALARHDQILHQSIADHEGVVFKMIGDAFCAAFHTAPAALTAAVAAQLALHREPWPHDVTLRVRMALHTGTADERDGDYFGPPLNRAARLLAAGHGGQILLSLASRQLTRDVLPVQCMLRDLGQRRLKDLARSEQVYQLLHPELPSEFPPLKSLDNPELPNNLPQQLTSFVGRERELGQVKDLLSKTRLLTLTGSGGSGKTRLSLQVAADLLDQYFDGVWLVELASLSDPNLIAQTVADVLGIPEQAGIPLMQTLTDSLMAKTLLLVLDNCEHVLDACARLADVLLRACPKIKVLASSREGLGIAGETVYRIPSLTLPDLTQTATPESLSQYEAVRLFIERAMLVKPDFAVTHANAPWLASVCHRLDGIPLALELAAARIRALTVEEINARLDNRFRLLTGGARTALPRQQTLRALIDWSYDLLTAQEKALLRRLSVFSGGWTLAAAEAVCAGEAIEDWEVLDLLTSLVDKSLVIAEETEGQTRYRFLETVRQYARDRLAEDDQTVLTRKKHRDCFLALVEEAGPKLMGVEQAHWFSVLEQEHDNLRQALTFCQEQSEADGPGNGEKWLRLGSGLYHFWQVRGHLSEGRERLSALLSHPQVQTPTWARANALNGAGNLAHMQGDYAPSWSLYQESLTIYRELGDRDGIAGAFNNLGSVALDQGDFALARAQLEESLAISRELGDRDGIANALNNLGTVTYSQGEHEQARSLYQECLTIQRELGSQNGIANALINLGVVAYEQGDYTRARSLYQECLTIQHKLGSRSGIASVLGNLGVVAASEGEYERARSLYQEGLTIHRELGDRQEIANTLNNLGIVVVAQGEHALARSLYQESLTLRRELDFRQGIGDSLEAFAWLAVRQGDPERAARLFGAAEELRDALGSPLLLSEIAQHDRDVATARAALGEEAFVAAWAMGRSMLLAQAVAYALEE